MEGLEYYHPFRDKYTNRYTYRQIYHELGVPISMNYSSNLFGGNSLSVGDTEGFLTLYKVPHMDNASFEDAEENQIRFFSRRVHNNSITEVKFQKVDPESDEMERYIYTSSTDSFIVKYDIEQEKESCKVRAHKEWVKKFSLSFGNASLIATVGNDGNFCIFDDRCFGKKAYLCSENKSNLTHLRDYSIDKIQKKNIIDYNTFKGIREISLIPRIKLYGIHEQNKRTHSIKRSYSRERLISKKNVSVSGVNFLTQFNYISTCGSSDGYIKIWDIRKLSDSAENNYIHKFSPQFEEKRSDCELRGIVWMDVDDYCNKLGVRTRDGTIYIYNILDILSLEKGVKPLVIDMNEILPEEKCELVDSSQKPSISCYGDWIATPSNSGNAIFIFDISNLNKKPEPYFVYKNENPSDFSEFQCVEWKKTYNITSLSHIFPRQGLKNQLGKVINVGKEYCSNFSVGTKLKYLQVFNNREFQVNFRKSVMPGFSDLSSMEPQHMDRTDGDKDCIKINSHWVSGESLSFSGSFDGDSEALNQLSLSSSLSIPVPKPVGGSVVGEGDIMGKRVVNGNTEIQSLNNSVDLQKAGKTGFLTLSNLGLSEKELTSSLDNINSSHSLVGEHVEKTPFRRSIPFPGSSQDSVGYPAPHRGQYGYVSQSQESLMTPKSFDNINSTSSEDVTNSIQSGIEKNSIPGECSYSPKGNQSRRVIHIPLSQSNEEVLGSPSLNSIEILNEIKGTEKNDIHSDLNDMGNGQEVFSDKCMYDRVNEDSSEEDNKGFKQRRLDSWIRIKRNIEASTTNNSSAELSPIS